METKNGNGIYKWLLGILLGASVPVIGFSIGYGILSQRVNEHEARITKLETLNKIVTELVIKFDYEMEHRNDILEKFLKELKDAKVN